MKINAVVFVIVMLSIPIAGLKWGHSKIENKLGSIEETINLGDKLYKINSSVSNVGSFLEPTFLVELNMRNKNEEVIFSSKVFAVDLNFNDLKLPNLHADIYAAESFCRCQEYKYKVKWNPLKPDEITFKSNFPDGRISLVSDLIRIHVSDFNHNGKMFISRNESASQLNFELINIENTSNGKSLVVSDSHFELSKSDNLFDISGSIKNISSGLDLEMSDVEFDNKRLDNEIGQESNLLKFGAVNVNLNTPFTGSIKNGSLDVYHYSQMKDGALGALFKILVSDLFRQENKILPLLSMFKNVFKINEGKSVDIETRLSIKNSNATVHSADIKIFKKEIADASNLSLFGDDIVNISLSVSKPNILIFGGSKTMEKKLRALTVDGFTSKNGDNYTFRFSKKSPYQFDFNQVQSYLNRQ